ncbi:hypothetical protein D3C86_2040610 [compost metagenome]
MNSENEQELENQGGCDGYSDHFFAYGAYLFCRISHAAYYGETGDRQVVAFRSCHFDYDCRNSGFRT